MNVQNDLQYKINMSKVQGAGGNYIPGAAPVKKTTGGAPAFSDIFSQAKQRNAASSLKISKHAEARLNERNIQLSGQQKEKIANALIKAELKGVRDALVMIDGFAVVANARSMTIITAAGEDDLRQNIFTNIDGAVFA